MHIIDYYRRGTYEQKYDTIRIEICYISYQIQVVINFGVLVLFTSYPTFGVCHILHLVCYVVLNLRSDGYVLSEMWGAYR